MRVLVANGASPVTATANEEWEPRHFEDTGRGLAGFDGGLVDFDVFIVPGKFPAFQGQSSETRGTDAIGLIRSRITAGGALLAFLDSPPGHWLADLLGVFVTNWNQVSGRIVRVPDDSLYLANALLDGRPPNIKYTVCTRLESQTVYDRALAGRQREGPIALTKDGRAIAVWYQLGEGRVYIVPRPREPGTTVRHFLDTIVPKDLPHLVETTLPSNPPAWLDQYRIDQATALSNKIAELRKQSRDLEERIGTLSATRQDLDSHRGLLWLDGRLLEIAVQTALNLLGIQVKKGVDPDLELALPSGQMFLAEIEGSKGPTKVAKGRQLLGYLGNLEDPASGLGAMITNPFNKQPPHERPRDGFHSRQLIALAAKQGWPLVTTTEVFELVKRKLGGDETADHSARHLLGLPVQEP